MPGEQLTYAPTLRCWRFGPMAIYKRPDLPLETTQDAIPRIANNQVNEQEFIDYFQAPNTQLPVMITGATGAWPAAERWATLERLETRFGNKKFKVGEDDDEHNAYLKFRYFIRCVREDVHRDDSPLYRFDCNLKDTQRNTVTKGSLKTSPSALPVGRNGDASTASEPDPVIPAGMTSSTALNSGASTRRNSPTESQDDGASGIPAKRLKPTHTHRPAQTGTGFHFNPLGTSAWNSLLVTRKRWALFPPRTPRELVDPPSMEAFDREVTSWFYHVLPKFHQPPTPDFFQRYGAWYGYGPCVDFHDAHQLALRFRRHTLGSLIGIVEGLHHPGETIYVPGGRQRVVINLDSTVATTQDICAPMPFDYIEPKTRLAWPGLAAKLECELKARRENRIESSE
ncbi:hypothetical protein H4R33_003042 [Dimargaris cristalligena]|nr:hypothetical protein H4R33_003042 [Dimargaris cristalligena]